MAAASIPGRSGATSPAVPAPGMRPDRHAPGRSRGIATQFRRLDITRL